MLDIRREADFKKERDFIRQSLESEIAQQSVGSRGRIEAGFVHDKQIQKALEVLASKNEYSKVLATANTPSENK